MTPQKKPRREGRGNLGAVAAPQGGTCNLTLNNRVVNQDRLPPYARRLADARYQGLVPRRTGFGQVCVQLDWGRSASAGLPRIVIPDDQGYRLDFLTGLDVLLIDEGDYHLETVIKQIVAAKPRRWDVVHLSDEGFFWGAGSC